MQSNMDVLIKLKIQLDIATGRISAFCMRKPVRYFFHTLKWGAVLFLVFDTYIYSISTGDTALFSTMVVFVLSSLMTRNKPTQGHQNTKSENRPSVTPGMKGVCEKCGAKVTINYGDAYHTLCDKCT